MSVHVVRKTTLQRLALLAAVLSGCAALLIWPQGAAAGVSRGLSICAAVIIPSLFPFLVLTGIFIRSGLAGGMGRRCGGLTRRLFGLPGCCGAAVLVGAIGGYPAGAAAVRDLMRQGEIDGTQAKKLLRFCVNAGPAFVIGTVGAGLLGSVKKGILLYIAHLLASLLIGLFGRGRQGGDTPCRPAASRPSRPMQTLVESVESACSSLLSMCGFVVLFSAFLSLSQVSGLTAAVTDVLALPFTLFDRPFQGISCLYPALWEVSCGCVEAAGSGLSGLSLPFLLGASLGWGGISVHCQIGGMFSETDAVDGGYFLARLWQALLGGGLSALLFWAVPLRETVPAAPTAATVVSAVPVQPVSVSVAASVAMLLMCGALLLGASRE